MLHWRTKKQDPMIESPVEVVTKEEEKQNSTLENFRKQRKDADDVLSKFRNYQI